MNKQNDSNNNSSQLVYLLLAFVAGVFAAKLWYDIRPSLESLPEEVTVAPPAPTEDTSPSEELQLTPEELENKENAPVGSTIGIPETAPGTEVPEDMETRENVELVSEADVLLLRQAFAEKYDNPLEDISVNPTTVDDSGAYVSGGVRLGEGPGNAGMFWAYKEAGEWIIAADGNGSPECSVLQDAGFPEDMQEGCF